MIVRMYVVICNRCMDGGKSLKVASEAKQQARERAREKGWQLAYDPNYGHVELCPDCAPMVSEWLAAGGVLGKREAT